MNITLQQYLFGSMITVLAFVVIRTVDLILSAKSERKPLTGKHISKLTMSAGLGLVFPPTLWLFTLQSFIRILINIAGKFVIVNKTSMSTKIANTVNKLAGTRFAEEVKEVPTDKAKYYD